MEYDTPEQIAESSILLANDMPLTSAQILENLHHHIELFDEEDQLAGAWAYNAIARILQREDHQKVVQAYYDDKYKAV